MTAVWPSRSWMEKGSCGVWNTPKELQAPVSTMIVLSRTERPRR